MELQLRGPYAFERYVNFEFYKTSIFEMAGAKQFERYVNFEFYKRRK